MKLIDIIIISLRNLSERSLRSWLTILGIIIGVVAVVIMLSIGEGMRRNVESQLSIFGPDSIMILPGSIRSGGGDITALIRLMATARGSAIFTQKDIETIKNLAGVEDVEGQISTQGFATYSGEKRSTFIRGVEISKWRKMLNLEIEEGRDFLPNEKRAVVLGYRIAYEGFKKPITIGSSININGVNFRVIGILKETGAQMGILDNIAFISIDDSRDLSTSFKKDQYSLILVKIRDPSKVDEIVKNIDFSLIKVRNENQDRKTFTVISAKQIAQTANMIVLSINIFLGGIAGVSLIVGGVGIANTMFTSVIERTRQIGTLKALGAKNSDIIKIFLFESAIIGLIGGLIGIFIGFIIVGFFNEFSIRTTPFPMGRTQASLITPNLIFIALLFSTLIGALSGILPARRAAKLEPVEALRYE